MATTAEHLIERLENIVKHVFTVPGDYILPFCGKLSESKKISLINCTDENHAGFAADGYARIQGVGCVCATWNVGALKLSNAIAGAMAERSPIIVISGSPGVMNGRENFRCIIWQPSMMLNYKLLIISPVLRLS